MYIFIYKILLGYFVLGAVMTYKVNQKLLFRKRQKNWLKFFTFLIITNGLFASIYFGHYLFGVLGLLIVFMGAKELLPLLKKWKGHNVIFLWYVLIGLSFIRFSFLPSPWLMYTFFMVTVFDGFSQLFGQLLGGPKILPEISPNKTYAGFVGGLISTILTSVWIREILDLNYYQATMLGMGIGLATFLGDLLASVVKRKALVKDYSQMIPGHGGFLDRFDGFLLAGCFCLAYFYGVAV